MKRRKNESKTDLYLLLCRKTQKLKQVGFFVKDISLFAAKTSVSLKVALMKESL